MDLSAGKLWRLRRLADADGHFRMLAIDQRPPIERLLEDRLGAVREEDLAALKRAVVDHLAGQASAVLADPLIAYPYGAEALDPARGLLVTLEHAVYDDTPGGRRSGPIPGWSVESIARLGADAVKVLAWYRPDADESVREHQQAWVAEVGAQCRRHDLPFVFELLVYPFSQRSGSGDSYTEDPGKRAEAVVESVETFADPAYGVDVFKLESPIPAVSLAGPDDPEFERHRAWFHALDRAADRPWVVLSAGADQDAFMRVLGHALASGASGFLAGRAIWWDAVSQFPDMDLVRARLASDALPYLQKLNEFTHAHARSWSTHPAFGPDGPRIAGADMGFVAHYGS